MSRSRTAKPTPHLRPLPSLRRQSPVRQRALHVIDLENLMGLDRDAAAVRSLWEEYGETVGVGPDDAVIVGTAKWWAHEAWFTLPSGVRRVLGHGPDGADIALLSAVDVNHDLARYSTFVIASGDHIFAPLAEEARARGRRVEVAIGAGILSWELARQASSIHCLASRTLSAAS